MRTQVTIRMNASRDTVTVTNDEGTVIVDRGAMPRKLRTAFNKRITGRVKAEMRANHENC